MARPKSKSEREKKTTSFMIYTDTKKKVNYIAVMEEIDITTIVETALQDYINKYEKRNGPIPIK